MIDYSFWNDPEVTAARADVIAAAEAFEAGHGEEPALELSVIRFNEVVDQVRTRLGHYKDEPDDGHKLTAEQYQWLRERRLEEAKVPPPQTAVLVERRTQMLKAMRDLDKPLGKWEREFNFNCSCMRYEGGSMTARREQRERELAWQETKPMQTMNTEDCLLSASG